MSQDQRTSCIVHVIGPEVISSLQLSTATIFMEVSPGGLSFSTQFALHFAASLVGASHFICRDSKSSSKWIWPVYWRSSNLRKQPLHFLDICIEPDVDAYENLIIYIGWLHSSANQSNRAVSKQQQLSYSQCRLRDDTLRKHWNDLGVDLETTPVSVLAKSMVKAWKRLGDEMHQDGASIAMVCHNDEKMVQFQLFYEDVDESLAVLELMLDSDCLLDDATLRMMRCNFDPPVLSLEKPMAHEDETWSDDQLESEFLRLCQARLTPGTKDEVLVDHARFGSADLTHVQTPAGVGSRLPAKSFQRGRVPFWDQNRKKKAKTLTYTKE